MTPLTLNEKRAVCGAWLALDLLALGNHYLDWNLFGRADKYVLALIQIVGLIAVVKYGPAMVEELRVRKDAEEKADVATELAQDPSMLAKDAATVRNAIGLSPNKALERSRGG